MRRLGIMFLAGLSLLSSSCTKEEVEDDPIIQEPVYKFDLTGYDVNAVVYDFGFTNYDDLTIPYQLSKLINEERIEYKDGGWLTYQGWLYEGQQQVLIQGCGDEASKDFTYINEKLDRYSSSIKTGTRFNVNTTLSKDTLYLAGIRHNSIWVGTFRSKDKYQIADYTGRLLVSDDQAPYTNNEERTMSVRPIKVVESNDVYFRLQNQFEDNVYLFKKQGNLLFCSKDATFKKWMNPNLYLLEDYQGSALVDMSTGKVKADDLRRIYYDPAYDFPINETEYLRFRERRFTRMSMDKGCDEIVWQENIYDAPLDVSKFEVVFEDKTFSETYRYTFTLHYWLKDGTKKSYYLKIDMSDGYFSLTEQ